MNTLLNPCFTIFWSHIRARRVHFAFSILIAACAVGISLGIPLFYKRFFDLIHHADRSNLMPFAHVLLQIFGMNIAYSIVAGIAGIVANTFEAITSINLTNSCFNALQYYSYKFYTNHSGGTLVQTISRFVEAFESLYEDLIWTWLPLTIELVVIFIIISRISLTISLIFLAWTILFFIASYLFSRFKFRYDLAHSTAKTSTAHHLNDSIVHNTVVKLFSGEQYETKSFFKINAQQLAAKRFTWNLGESFAMVKNILIFTLELFVFYFSLKLWQKNQISIGDFILIQTYLITLFRKLVDVQRAFRKFFQYVAEADQMATILMDTSEKVSASSRKKLAVTDGAIQFKDVNFGYHKDQQIIHDINLAIKPKEKIALVGASGSGKSTLIKLLLRFFEINKGEVLIDGMNITDATLESVRNNISLVPQEPIFFQRSIYENIRYGNLKATPEDIYNAAREAYCYDFIMELPDKFDTMMGAQSNLSGGQRQRIAIARALLKNAPILILDEATSSLDVQSEHTVQAALEKLMVNKTVIVVAHRLATIKNIDRIIVLEKGSIIEEGTHDALIAQNNKYAQLWNMQEQTARFIPAQTQL